MANDEVSQCLQGGQVQVSGPQLPLAGHEDEIENPDWEGGQRLGQRGLGYVGP